MHTHNPEQLRNDAAAGWQTIRAGLDSSTSTLERRYVDAPPGVTVSGNGSESIAPRARCGFDADRLDLIADNSRSQRVSPNDVQLGSLGLFQLGDMGRTFGSDSRARFGFDGADPEVALTSKIFARYGTDPDRLWRVGSHSAAFLRTVSRAASRMGGDSWAQLFIGSELTLQLGELVEIEKRYPSARDFFPMKFLNAPGALDYEFRKLDRRGRAEHTANFEGDAPTAAVFSDPIKRPLRWMRSGISFSWQEIEQWKQARANGSPLPDVVALQLKTAREALLDLENIDLMFGNAGLQITGLLSGNQSIATPAAIANYVNAADSEAAVQAMLIGPKAVYTARYRGEMVLGLGTRDYVYVNTATYAAADSTGQSLAAVALERGKGLGLRAIVEVPELGYEAAVKTALEDIGYKAPLSTQYAGGLGGKAVAVTMIRDPNFCRGIVGQDMMQFPPDKTSTRTKIQIAASTGGLEVRQPGALHIQTLNDPS